MPLTRALLTLALMDPFQHVTASAHISLYDLAGVIEPSSGWPILEDAWSLVSMFCLAQGLVSSQELPL